jgi:hypothetical protein
VGGGTQRTGGGRHLRGCPPSRCHLVGRPPEQVDPWVPGIALPLLERCAASAPAPRLRGWHAATHVHPPPRPLLRPLQIDRRRRWLRRPAAAARRGGGDAARSGGGSSAGAVAPMTLSPLFFSPGCRSLPVANPLTYLGRPPWTGAAPHGRILAPVSAACPAGVRPLGRGPPESPEARQAPALGAP